MTDPRSDAVKAIRTRLGTVVGLWPVAYQGISYTPVPQTPYLAEEFVFGNEDDTAMPDKTTGKRWREATEFYQLMLHIPVDNDPRVAVDMANTIARTFLDTPVTTAGGVPLWFSSYRLMSRGVDSGWQKYVLVLTYRYIYNV